MSRSIIKLTAIIALIAGLLFIALYGLDFTETVRFPGILDPDGVVQGLDLKGGSVIVFEAQENNPTDEQMETVTNMMRTRLDGLGYTEATVTRQGLNKVRIEIPSLSDPAEAAEALGATAQLQFIAPIGGAAPVVEETAETTEGTEADETAAAEEAEAPVDLAAQMGGSVILTGSDVKDAKAQYGPLSEMSSNVHYVELSFTEEGRKKFADATGQVITLGEGNNFIAIAMDNNLISMPRVAERIDSDTCTISGDFTAESARELAAQIRSGQLPFSLSRIELRSISATLGDTALQTSLLAGLIGIILVMLFMIAFYRLPGFLASIALAAYMSIIGIILATMHINLTLPGIAGIILSIGMAVDANVIIFERIKEELRIGKTVRSAVDAGFNRALSAVIDSNITTIIAAVILIIMGTGTIKGFGTTLLIGVVISMISAIFVTKFLLKQMIGMNVKNPWFYGINKKKEDTANA
ncbi:MAG: protein translocase subunit SecD [Ruminococcaceae bacterium]|nr:protein translocase subunit SecD [Oscillospiraceae bacterium]